MQLATPYKGALPFFEEDADFFFGREAEIELVCEIFRAAPLTVLFGAKGVGKTSLLRAGVIPHLKRTAAQPERVIVFDSWRDNAVARFASSLRHASHERIPNFLSLDSIVRAMTRDEKLLIILDQFEESAVEPFAQELARLANQRDLPVHFLLSARDEAEPALQALQAKLPHLFDSMLRLRPLSFGSARAAIIGPIEVFNSRNPGLEMRIEPEAIEGILEAARDEAPVDNGVQLDTGKLQRIVAALWDYEFASGMDTMRLSSLNALLTEKHAETPPRDDEIFDDVRPPWLLVAHEPLPAISQPAAPAEYEEIRERNLAWKKPVYAALGIAFAGVAIFYWTKSPEPEVTHEAITSAKSNVPVAVLPAAESLQPPAASIAEVAAAEASRNPVDATAAPAANGTARPIAEPANAPRVFIHVREESPASLELVRQLQRNGINVSGVKKVDQGPGIIDLRYFHPRQKQEANEIARRLKQFDIQIAQVKYIKGYEDTAKDRQYELWFPPDALN
jgi:hypothetical protein